MHVTGEWEQAAAALTTRLNLASWTGQAGNGTGPGVV
jgi:hypothetical protein